MLKIPRLPPEWALLPVGIGTALSLLGDSSLYAVLPTQTEAAGVTVAAVGILLSANRMIRIVLNGPVGMVCDRVSGRAVFIPALFIGAGSTAMYGLTQGFWPLLAARLLWGLAWAGIWVGGTSIVLQIGPAHTRGRRVGLYQFFFYMGASTGAVMGGILTDWLSYQQAMLVEATLTLLGAVFALLFLPGTRPNSLPEEPAAGAALSPPRNPRPDNRPQLVSAISLFGVNRLLMAGVLLSTLGLLLQAQIGASVQWLGLVFGVATLTGLGLGLNSFISMLTAPLAGSLSDRLGRRWPVVVAGLAAGLAGFGLLSWGWPAVIMLSIPLLAVCGGSSQSLSTTLVGDLAGEQRRGRWLGLTFTVGDIASAAGPLLAYSLLAAWGLAGVYLLAAATTGLMLLVSLYWAARGTG